MAADLAQSAAELAPFDEVIEEQRMGVRTMIDATEARLAAPNSAEWAVGRSPAW
jgi:hypothetical protein